jgi:hypothetical protein
MSNSHGVHSKFEFAAATLRLGARSIVSSIVSEREAASGKI